MLLFTVCTNLNSEMQVNSQASQNQVQFSKNSHVFNDSTNVSPFTNIKNPFCDRTASTVKGFNRPSDTVQYQDRRPRLEIQKVIGHGAFGK